jgi:glycosyltransferase involved in cell wall biosynthesis
MIHFTVTYTEDASDTPFAHELRASGIPHRLLCGKVLMRYRNRLWLLLVGWPRLLLFALSAAWTSLVRGAPRAQTVVLGSDIEVLVYGLLRALLRRREPRIVLVGFIYTLRKNGLVNRLRRRYFSVVLAQVDRVICHSAMEVTRYEQLFGGARGKFVHIAHGLHIHGRDETPARPASVGARPYLLSAGRSGRDYQTLFAAMAELPIDLHVVCDSDSMLAGLAVPANVQILRNCYDGDYVEQLRHAELVVVPLGVNDISAGQMVVIQAMAFGKPTVVTDTPTIREYVTHGEHALLVRQGDVAELRAAISWLLQDRAMARRLSANAVQTFDEQFCMRAFVRRLLQAALA